MTENQTTETNELGETVFAGYTAREVSDLCDMLARSADQMTNGYSETASIARRARDAIRFLLGPRGV